MQLSVTDSADQLAAFQSELADLRTDGKLSAILDQLDNAANVATHHVALNSLLASVTIRDSAVGVAGALDQLALVDNLLSISLTDLGTPSLTVNLASLTNDGAVLGVISGPFTLTVSDTGAAISADLAAGHSMILSYLGEVGSITTTSGVVSLTQAQILAVAVDTNVGDALTKYGGTLDVTGVDVAHLTAVAGLRHAPDTIEMSDNAANITADLIAGSRRSLPVSPASRPSSSATTSRSA